MLGPKLERLERRIKELNAIKGGYRSEVDDAFRQLKDKKIAKDEFERIRLRNEERMERLNEKIRELRAQIQAIKQE
jgi:predicted  nucleic acid-binding Zn-ribbon protein